MIAPDTEVGAGESEYVDAFISGIVLAAEKAEGFPVKLTINGPNPLFVLCLTRLSTDRRIQSFVQFYARDLPVAYTPYYESSNLRRVYEWAPDVFSVAWAYLYEQIKHVFFE